MTNKEFTFNDIPSLLAKLFDRMEQLEKNSRLLTDAVHGLRNLTSPPSSGRTLMNTDEAAEYLRIAKNSLYENFISVETDVKQMVDDVLKFKKK